MEMIHMKFIKKRKLLITIGLIVSVWFLCFTSGTTLIFVGNSYENSQDVNVTISLDKEIIYSGFLPSYEIPQLLEKKKMKVGFYKVSAKLDDMQLERCFFYFFQKSIWIDFDFTTNNILLISKFYRQIPL